MKVNVEILLPDDDIFIEGANLVQLERENTRVYIQKDDVPTRIDLEPGDAIVLSVDHGPNP